MAPSSLTTLLFLWFSSICFAQFGLEIKEKIPVDDMVEYVAKGNRIEILDVQFIGNRGSIALYQNDAYSETLNQGLVMTTGISKAIPGPNKDQRTTGQLRIKGDQDLESLLNTKTFDANILMIDFIPKSEIIYFKYLFASEEYNEFVGSSYNDAFAFFLIDSSSNEKINLAITPNTGNMISVNTVNNKINSGAFLNNELDIYGSKVYGAIEFDGITKPLTAFAKVIPGKKYTLKLVLADAADEILDSGVFIEAHSFQSCSEEEFRLKNQTFFENFGMDSLAIELALKELPLLGGENVTVISEHSSTQKMEEVVTDTSFIQYQFDEFKLNDQQKEQIKKYIETQEGNSIVLNAYTDAKGSESYNQLLSLKRVLAVKNYIESLGYKVKEANAFGIDFSNKSDEAKRRVEIIIQ